MKEFRNLFVLAGKSRLDLLTDVVDDAGAELAEELLSAECLEVVDGVRPEMKDVIPRETVALLDDDDASSEQSRLDGNTETDRPSTDHQHLQHRVTHTPTNTSLLRGTDLINVTRE